MTRSHHDILLDVLAASRRWVQLFNQGRVGDCVALYAEDAVMHGRPFGLFTGRDAIQGFWGPLVESGAGAMAYTNIRLQVVSPAQVRLSADWRMSVGRGIISNELWERNAEGEWMITQDDFEVLERFAR